MRPRKFGAYARPPTSTDSRGGGGESQGSQTGGGGGGGGKENRLREQEEILLLPCADRGSQTVDRWRMNQLPPERTLRGKCATTAK